MNVLYEKSVRELLRYVLKRFVMLGAKLLGFKSFCLALATVLLGRGIISGDIWLYVVITVVCSASGLRIADACSFRMPASRQNGKEETDDYRKTCGDDLSAADRSVRSGSSVRDAVAAGERRIRRLLVRGGRPGAGGGGPGRSDPGSEPHP
jgi:hypothetical protein